MLASETRPNLTPDTGAVSPIKGDDWKAIVMPVEPFLHAVANQLSAQIQEFDADIASYAEYALTAQGKQLRPALVALAGGAVGEVNGDHVRAAVIIEMVHLATLVHDDVMDEAGLRRGRPTLAANWGNEISVLVGDCLFAQALKLAAGFPTTEICRAVASATNTVVTGEILQTQRRNRFDLPRAEYFKVLEMKTGELFALSCDLGAYLSGSSNAQRTALRDYGMTVGTAYQVYDDCLDLYGVESVAGKSLGTDLAKGKLTLPMLVLLERASAEERKLVCTLLRDWDPANHGAVMRLLKRHKVLADAQASVHRLLETAGRTLKALPESDSRDSLAGFIRFLTQQTDGLERSV
jgi:octaprenyl-diphosphate synthase